MTSGPVLNVADAKLFPNRTETTPERFGAEVSPIANAIGAKKLGCMLHVVQPGKTAFPFHNHHGNEEMFVILEGTGTYRLGAETYPVKAGDVCSAPAGGAETAHQISNTGDTVLKYLAFSTRQDPEVVEYPDSGKFGCVAVGEGRDFFSARLRFVGRAGETRDYWEGEE